MNLVISWEFVEDINSLKFKIEDGLDSSKFKIKDGSDINNWFDVDFELIMNVKNVEGCFNVSFKSVVKEFIESGVEFAELSAGSSDFESEDALDVEFAVFNTESLEFERELYLSA